MSWQIEHSDFFGRRFKRFEKNHPAEATAVLDNLDTYFEALSAMGNPLQVKAGFIHPEQEGIIAIDQSGGKGKLMQTRLYIYPECERRILHIISIGTKTDQGRDIQECREYIRPLKNGG